MISLVTTWQDVMIVGINVTGLCFICWVVFRSGK